MLRNVLLLVGLLIGAAVAVWSERRDPQRFDWSVRPIARHIAFCMLAMAPAALTSIQWVDGDGWQRLSIVALAPITAVVSLAVPWFSVVALVATAIVGLAAWQVAKIFMKDFEPAFGSIRRLFGWISTTPQQRAGVAVVVLFLVTGLISGPAAVNASYLVDGIFLAILLWASFTRWGVDRLGIRGIIVYVVLSYFVVFLVPNSLFQPSRKFEETIIASFWPSLAIVLIGLGYEVWVEIRQAKTGTAGSMMTHSASGAPLGSRPVPRQTWRAFCGRTRRVMTRHSARPTIRNKMSHEINSPLPDSADPGSSVAPKPKKKIAPEMLVVGLSLVGMIVVGIVLFIRSGSDGDSTVASNDAITAPTEPARDEAIATTQDVPTSTASEAVSTTASTTEAPTSVAATTSILATVPAATIATTTVAPTTTAATIPVDPEVVSSARLAELIAADAQAMASLEEQWVPQLSAKALGTEWQGVTYDFQAILAEHEALRERYGAILVDGATYSFRIGGQPMAGWYITLVPRAYPTSEGALAWCNAEQINSDDCFAKLITNRLDAGDTIVLNP